MEDEQRLSTTLGLEVSSGKELERTSTCNRDRLTTELHHHTITITFIMMRAKAKGWSMHKGLASTADLDFKRLVGEGWRLRASGGTGGLWSPAAMV